MSNLDRTRMANKSAPAGKAEDIPAALRDRKTQSQNIEHSISSPLLPIGRTIVGLGILAIGGALVWFATAPRNAQTASAPTPVASSTPAAIAPVAESNSATNTDNLLNHLPYAEAPESELVSIGGGYRLRKSAAAKFQAMVAAARASGINITTISAFRSVEDQKRLFFGVGAQRGQQPTKRAEVSAPPKYSEHHTGYAIDVGDGAVPATNLNQNFETTPAFKWLKANAATYSFEISFPKDNIQKVSYEPWHWRFVGDINSLETFYKARNLQSK